MVQETHGHASCHTDKSKADWLLRGSAFTVAALYAAFAFFEASTQAFGWLHILAQSIFELVNTIWWGVSIGVVMVAVLAKIPREFVVSVLGTGGGLSGIIRATIGGILLDLCSHGILMVGAKLYERGVTAGQTVAFLVASPWNSFSLTLVLIALIGLNWTLAFIGFSMAIAIIAGVLFDWFVGKGILPQNPNKTELPDNFRFWPDARKAFKSTVVDGAFLKSLIMEGARGSRPVLRWILFGVVLAGLVRAFLDTDSFQTWFGPSLAGLGLTVLVATIMEVCSEGSTPIAADLLTRAKAPGNSFAFLMTGVATDYTEIMILKETAKSWKFALFLPLVTLPQVLAVAWLMNVI